MVLKLLRTLKNQLFPRKFGNEFPFMEGKTHTEKCSVCWLKAITVVVKTFHDNPAIPHLRQEETYYCEFHRPY